MSEKLRRFTKAVYGLDAVVRRVDDGAWGLPSPCPEWAARDVVGHQIQVMGMVADAARGTATDRGFTTPREAAGEDPAAAWAAARDDVLDALDHEGSLQRETESPFGPMTVDRLIGILYVDPLTHTWDLGLAAGVDPALDAELCTSGANQLERAGEAIRGPGMYAAALPYADDADPATRFVAVAGRNPAFSSR
jgi:uncharacterized protein (TIGR03086 family)